MCAPSCVSHAQECACGCVVVIRDLVKVELDIGRTLGVCEQIMHDAIREGCRRVVETAAEAHDRVLIVAVQPDLQLSQRVAPSVFDRVLPTTQSNTESQ